MWPLRLEEEDTTYALSFEADDLVENHTVQSLCRKMTYDLLLPFERNMPKVNLGNHYQLSPKSRWSPFGREVGMKKWDAMKQWAAARPGKRLHELQIAVCEQAIAAAPTMQELSEEEQREMIGGLTKEINAIRKSGQPVVIKTRFQGEYYVTYSAERLEALRQKLRGRAANQPE